MKTMKWLLRREFWEHKGAFFWTPVAVAAAMLLLSFALLILFLLVKPSGFLGKRA